MPPPTPPSVNDGRMIAGKPVRPTISSASASVARQAAGRHVEADFLHRVAEQQPILAHLDGVDLRADQLDAVLGEDALLVQRHGEVQRCLPSDGRQHGIGTLTRDDRLGDIGRQRLDVRAIRKLRVRHDRRRVAVDQHDLETFVLSALQACVPE